MSVVDAIHDIFGKESNIPQIRISNLLKLSWQGDMCQHDGMRAMCWRVLLGLISSKDMSLWEGQLAGIVTSYTILKNRVMPSIDKVKDDPLSALSVGDSMSEEWSAYYKNVELINFLKGDLDRLFLTGLEDEYFQSKEKRELLTAILFIWSMEHPLISYRQGMHEVLGSILYAVDCEKNAWANVSSQDNTLAKLFNEINTEAYAFAIFDRIMLELAVLYDPLPVAGIENQPYVVQYCTKIQEHYLQLLDPALARHLEESYIQSQLYGLRWSRLLLGREFTLANGNQMFRLWDFMFAACYDAENNSAEELLDDSAPPNVYSVLANTRIQGYKKTDNVNKRVNKTDKITYVCTPLLAALADCMLAMMIQVRDQLLEGDSSIVMATLMRYPEQASVLPVIECADMIRRGVLVRFIDSKGSVLNYNYDTMAPVTPSHATAKTPGRTPGGENHHLTTPQSAFRGGIYHDVGKKMTERINQVSASISDLVQAAIAPMMDGNGDEDEPYNYNNNNKFQDSLPSHIRSNTNLRTPLSSKSNNNNNQTNTNKKRNSKTEAVLSPVDLEDTDSDNKTDSSTNNNNNSNSSKFDPNVDPLTGAKLSTNINNTSSSTKASSSNNNTVPLPYAISQGQKAISSATNNPSYSILFDEGGASNTTQQQTPTTKASRSGSLSLFKPREWFSSSSSTTSASTAHQQPHNNLTDHNNVTSHNNDRRISGGFNLPVLHSSGTTHDMDAHNSHANLVPLKKKGLIAQNATVGDRLQDLADYLMHFSATINSNNANNSINNSEISNNLTSTIGDEGVVPDDDACFAVAKRLRALADVLAGQYSVVDYDLKYANKTLPASLIPSAAQSAVATRASLSNNNIDIPTSHIYTYSDTTIDNSSTVNSEITTNDNTNIDTIANDGTNHINTDATPDNDNNTADNIVVQDRSLDMISVPSMEERGFEESEPVSTDIAIVSQHAVPTAALSVDVPSVVSTGVPATTTDLDKIVEELLTIESV